MNHRQHPLGSGLSPASTARDVIGGIDLSGSNIIVTGGLAGIGLEVSRALAEAGAAVTATSRNPARAMDAMTGIPGVAIAKLDLLDPDSIDDFATTWIKLGRPLHILINGAGASGGPVRDARGYETNFATNHLGHFQLTQALLPALLAAKGARIVNVSSGAHRFSDIHWNDPHLNAEGALRAAYPQSKTANVLHAVELDHRYASSGIRAYACHPGVVVGTRLNNAAGEEALRSMGLIDKGGRPIIDPEVGKKTPQQGASTIVFGAVSPLLASIGGVYLKDNDISALDPEFRALTADFIPADVAPHAIDPASARRLWDLSERLLRR